MINITRVDHIGIRVADLDRAMEFYRVLGFDFEYQSENDAVVIINNGRGIEINLIHNVNDTNGGQNILMDVDQMTAEVVLVDLQKDT